MQVAAKKALIGVASAGLLAVLGASPAAATPVSGAFVINPSFFGLDKVFLGTPTETNLTIASDSTIYQGSGSQTEHGIAWGTAEGFTNDGLTSNSGLGGQVINAPGFYGLYFTYTATVSGLSGFGPGQSGTVTSFNYSLFGDPTDDDVVTPGTHGPSPTDPTLTNTGDDILLGTGSLISGSAGFESDGTPFFSASTNFNITPLGTGFFISPSPFYTIAFIGTTPSSASDIKVDVTCVATTCPNANLNGIGGSVSFAGTVPEPLTLSLFGAGLLGVGKASASSPHEEVLVHSPHTQGRAWETMPVLCFVPKPGTGLSLCRGAS